MSDFEDNLQEQQDEVLALQSIYNTDDDNKVKAISEANDDGGGRTSVIVSVNVKPVCDQIQVHIAMPGETEEEEEQLGAAATAAQNRPAFPENTNVKINRSMSGRNWEGSFRVKYLSPMLMYITFPPSYPSHSPPDYHIICSWLSPLQVQALSHMLNQQWQEASYMPVIFTWVDWLENNALDYLGISEHLTLHHDPAPDGGVDPVEDEAASVDVIIPWEEEIGQRVASLIQYNRELVDIEFCQNFHECEVCFDEKSGTQFFRLRDCSHKFCHECMLAFCELHVNDGTVEELRCPDTKCNTLVPPYVLQAVLDPLAYDRWETLLLQKTLDAMSDTVYCPRCQSLVIREEEEDLHLGQCTFCYFSFCTQCQQSWHQGSACQTDDEKMEAIQNRNRQALTKEEQKKYDELVRKMEEEAATKTLKKKNTIPCPKCKIPVEKIGGCNKMTCRCGAGFCWICGKCIDGYAHFREAKCILFPGQNPIQDEYHRRLFRPPEAILRMRARIAVNPDLQNDQTRCPACKQLNLKVERNNHIKCWNCKSNFCFTCRGKISGMVTEHFKGPCRQHS